MGGSGGLRASDCLVGCGKKNFGGETGVWAKFWGKRFGVKEYDTDDYKPPFCGFERPRARDWGETWRRQYV